MPRLRRGPSPVVSSPSELGCVTNIVVVDVRSAEEFAAGHVDGAINIPLDVLPSRASTLPRNALVVTVCGKGGGRSERAAMELRALGFRSARSLCEGTQAWMQLAAHDEDPLHPERGTVTRPTHSRAPR